MARVRVRARLRARVQVRVRVRVRHRDGGGHLVARRYVELETREGLNGLRGAAARAARDVLLLLALEELVHQPRPLGRPELVLEPVVEAQPDVMRVLLLVELLEAEPLEPAQSAAEGIGEFGQALERRSPASTFTPQGSLGGWPHRLHRARPLWSCC